MTTATRTPPSPSIATPGSTSDGVAPLLEVTDLRVHFPVTRGFVLQRRVGVVKAVDGISFTVKPGETLGLVGESGSGKTTTGRAVMMLTRPTQGSIRFEGQELTTLGAGEMRRMRRRMGIVFQDPQGSLNPRMTAGNIVGEPLIVHGLY
ncbi:MAG: ATP-binding cassette domain-containing protein, partial [Chloroflexi bacterium]|nr:ATP-binding cassette domain-containing protein [Chloroflexota bacterium]